MTSLSWDPIPTCVPGAPFQLRLSTPALTWMMFARKPVPNHASCWSSLLDWAPLRPDSSCICWMMSWLSREPVTLTSHAVLASAGCSRTALFLEMMLPLTGVVVITLHSWLPYSCYSITLKKLNFTFSLMRISENYLFVLFMIFSSRVTSLE